MSHTINLIQSIEILTTDNNNDFQVWWVFFIPQKSIIRGKQIKKEGSMTMSSLKGPK